MPRRLIALACLVIPVAAYAKWSPPERLKIKWPAQFSVGGEVPTKKVQEGESLVCAHGKQSKLDYVYFAKAIGNRFDTAAAGDYAKSDAKFDVLKKTDKELSLKRGNVISWVSWSIRAAPTRAVVKVSSGYAEVFYELDIPPTNITGDSDWEKLCNEASSIIDAGAGE